MLLSVVIPARNESGSLPSTLGDCLTVLRREQVPFELIVVDDGSTDDTISVVSNLDDPAIRIIANPGENGFGLAIRFGIEQAAGDVIAIMMADASDSPEDLVKYYRVIDYPSHKLLMNRLANLFIRVVFGLRFNDITNAFKCYRRAAIDGMMPLISPHFNLTVEMPLKAIIRGYSFKVVPISWTNRKEGVSKLKIKEMGSRYLFIVLYLWLEKALSRGDYIRKRKAAMAADLPASRHA